MKNINIVLIILVSSGMSLASEYGDSYESDIFSPSAEEYLFDSSEMTSLTINNLDEVMEDLAKEPSPRRSMKIATMDVNELVANLESMDPLVVDDVLDKMSQQQELYTKVLNKVDLPDDWYAKEEYNLYARLENQREREFEELISKHKEREAQLPKKKLSPRLKRILAAAKKIKNGQSKLRIKDEKVSPRSAMVGEKALSLLGEEEISYNLISRSFYNYRLSLRA